MTLEEAFEVELAQAAAKRHALEAERCATDLAIQLRIAERRLATLHNSIAVANGYLAAGQYGAARQILEALP
jgi:hypothetical protein